MGDPALAWAEDWLGGRVVAVEPLIGGTTSRLRVLTARDRRRVVLREITEEPWRTHGVELAAREHETLRLLTGSAVPAPVTIALETAALPFATHLMGLLPGRADDRRGDAAAVESLAAVLAAIHAVTPEVRPRVYQSWAWEAKYVVPSWSRDAGLWEAAFALLREPLPEDEGEHVLLHRDYGPHNVLWEGDRLSGVVDWVETSWGPAWLDVAHCRTNLVLRGGPEPGRAFAAAYARRTGRERSAYVEVTDVVGFLPRPGGGCFTDDPGRLGRLEAHLRDVLPG